MTQTPTEKEVMKASEIVLTRARMALITLGSFVKRVPATSRAHKCQSAAVLRKGKCCV
jgi:hypothetical protein